MKPRKDAPAGAAQAPHDCEEIERYRAPALDKGLDILELLAEQKEGLTRTEITKELGRNASEIYRMLERLVARQYVIRSPGGDRYTLSLKLYSLAHRHPPLKRLIGEALPPMQRFADAAEQSCHLCVYDRGNLLVIAQVDGPGTWGISVRLGSRVGLVDTASGPVLLAFQTPEQRARMLVEHTKVEGEIALDMREFDALLHEIRASGRLRQKSRQAFGVTDIAYPVLGPSGHAIAALTCPYVRRIDTHAAPCAEDVDAQLRATARHLSMLKEAAA
ncbi:IclR family transcriptional regulator [Burkholderia pseudomallei]|uniref:IclR family transcriptional regulator n=1 Tax=Burkholderia pseudomallei TaxID=28450 RepID=UPI000976A6F2|nr:IclR family transcriptional regulator [Burkholderia pseudomallei]AYX39631.1 IclR family transcriptional regulator [Burkholderia pseudomallei]ONE02055.1 IclR family transcriptional regulator [Burkholderia pseudomallei]ONE03048.1 IclR family transcriptional regulator [Burkholderia pseudomallei]CAJ3348310.1 IclR family transcriptional regulator [Burkholderia pseudomallei]CAJ3674243.1 IclR family transcriptional regulator [Burkholderia pseudomallei]